MRLSVLILLILFWINPPSFTQTIHSELKSLSHHADIILIGKVVEQLSEWNAENTAIFTTVTIAVDEFFKGNNNQSTIKITHPGGEVGDVGELYSHVPGFTKDENVLLFVKKSKTDDTYKVLEGEVGKISLRVNSNTGEKVTADNKNLSAFRKQINSYLKTQ